jgi:hypothetical protein
MYENSTHRARQCHDFNYRVDKGSLRKPRGYRNVARVPWTGEMLPCFQLAESGASKMQGPPRTSRIASAPPSLSAFCNGAKLLVAFPLSQYWRLIELGRKLSSPAHRDPILSGQ